MRRQSLDTLQLRPSYNKRYNASIPQGRLTDYDNTEIPVVRNKTSSIRPLDSTGTLKPMISQRNGSKQLSVSSIDNQLRSLPSGKKAQPDFEQNGEVRLTLDEEKKQKANLKFLRYKFNPTEEPVQTLNRKTENTYGQYRNDTPPITINMLYERNNVFFEDSRVPSVYKRFFQQSL